MREHVLRGALAAAVALAPTRTIASPTRGPTHAHESAARDAPLRAVLSHTGPARAWRYIVLHHSATAGGSPRAFEAFHRSSARNFPLGMAYHFVIGNGRGMPDGAIEAGSRWRQQQQGAHIAARLRDAESGANMAAVSIGICLVGDFEQSRPTAAQRASLTRLVRALRSAYRIPAARVRGHRAVHPGHTACPGRGLEPTLEALTHEAPARASGAIFAASRR